MQHRKPRVLAQIERSKIFIVAAHEHLKLRVVRHIYCRGTCLGTVIEFQARKLADIHITEIRIVPDIKPFEQSVIR